MSGVVTAVALLAASLALVEALRRVFSVPCELTRRLFFALVGAVAVFAVLRVPDPLWRAFPFACLAGVAYLSFRYELLASLEDDGPGPGSFLFPAAAAFLLALVPSAHVALAAILAVSFGDTLAALVGRRTGTRKYRIFGHARTMEGTLALFLGASAAIAFALIVIGEVEPHRAVAFALIAGTAAASVESACPCGTDNLAVPLATALTLSLLERFSV